MPGVVPAKFLNPLRALGFGPPAPGVRIIDVYLDIIAPEMAAGGISPPGIFPGHPRVEEAWVDPEADYVRRRADNRVNNQPVPLVPSTPQPGGGHLLDVTWAFNQATGARPEQWEVDDILGDGLRPPPRMEGGASYPVDPLTDEVVFPINTNLPSLNRLPGIIFVPAGWFPILGTIRLFGGQQIIGVAATSEGSVLVKYGDGACIRVQSPTNYADDRHLTVERALRYHHDVVGVGELTELLARFEADYSAALAAAPEVPPPWLADDSKRRETLRKTLAAGRFGGFSQVHIASVLLRQENWSSPDGRVRLQAAQPVDDDLGNPFLPTAYSQHVGGLRPHAVFCTSAGIDLVGCANSMVEDVVVTGFSRGIGIRLQPRGVPGGANVAYYNQIRHCQVEGCYVGIFFQQLLAFGFGSENNPETAANFAFQAGGANSSTIFHCQVRALLTPGEPIPRAAIELGSRTSHLVLCTVEAPPETIACVISQYSGQVIHHNRFSGGRFHLLLPPSVDWRAFTEDETKRLHFRRQLGDVDVNPGTTFIHYNRFVAPDGQSTPARMYTIEFPIELRNFARHTFAETPSQRVLHALPYRLLELSDRAQTSAAAKVSLDGNGLARGLQTEWTSTNLLSNSSFAADRQGWEQLPPAGVQAELVMLEEPMFTGRAMRVRSAGPTGVYRFWQPLTPPYPRADRPPPPGLMGDYARLRGTRLVGACWVRADQLDVVSIGFLQGAAVTPFVQARANWRQGEWLLLTAYLDVPEIDYPYLLHNDQGPSVPTLLNISFQVKVDLMRGATEVYFGAPQVNLGPELFPVGPTPLGPQALGPLQFVRGPSHTQTLAIPTGQSQGSTLIGIPARLEKIVVEAEPAPAKQSAQFEVELLGEKHRRPLCTFEVLPDGRCEMKQPLAADQTVMPGDLVVTRRLGGPPRGVDVYLQLVHSQVV